MVQDGEKVTLMYLLVCIP